MGDAATLEFLTNHPADAGESDVRHAVDGGAPTGLTTAGSANQTIVAESVAESPAYPSAQDGTVSAAGAELFAQESFAQRVDCLQRVVERHPLHREINVEILRFCQGQRVLHQVEEHIVAMPQFTQATLAPYRLIASLERAGGLERFCLDEDGQILTNAQLEGLSEDQVDDLVADYAFQTTDEGERIVRDASPRERIDCLLEAEPRLLDTYAALLSFFEEGGRSYDSVCELMHGSDALLRMLGDGSIQCMQPSVFVDRLERAGAIIWDEGWMLTEGGREALDRLLG